MGEWKKYRLADFADINMGQSPKSEFYNTEKIGLPFLQGNRTFGKKYPYFDTYCSEPKKVAKKGEVLLSVRAPVGDINIASEEICIGRGLASLNAKNNNNEYLYFLLHYLKTIIINNESGSVFGAVNKTALSNITFFLPPPPKQKAIAAVLSSLDDKIDLLHRQNKTLEQMAETLFRQWFVEEADEGWEESTLPDEFDFLMGQSPKGTSFNEEGIGTPMYQGNADFDFRFPNRRIYTTEAKRLAQKYETLISVRAPVGEQNMAIEECCIGRGVAAFKYKEKPEHYTYTYFKMRSLMDEIKLFNNEGTVFGSISKTDFQSLVITIPPKIVVYKFQNEVKPIDDKVIENTIQIRTLEKMRDTLLPKLMSGEVRVVI